MSNSFGGMGKDAIRENNMFAVLSCLYKSGPVSRRDIAKMVHLTPSTVTLLVADMLSVGLLRECGEVDEGPRAGRRMVELDFNPAFGYFLGISIEPAQLSFALTRLCGDMAGNCVIDRQTVANHYPSEKLLGVLLRLADAFVGRQAAVEGRFCAVGISMTGHVDPANGISLNSYGVLPQNLAVAKAFEEHFGVPAFLDNNVRSLAQAEMTLYSSEDGLNGLFIKQDPGFGCTVLLGGEVFEGAANSSGEIGHARVVENGRQCICGKTGCLSTFVGTNALIDAARAVFGPSATPVLWEQCRGQIGAIDVPSLVQSAAAGDEPVVRMLSEAARLMAGVLESSLLLMDGDCIITFGPLFAGEWFFDRLRTELEESFGGFRKIHLMRSRLSDTDRWKGAIFIALRKYLRHISGEICGGMLKA